MTSCYDSEVKWFLDLMVNKAGGESTQFFGLWFVVAWRLLTSVVKIMKF